MKVYNCYNQSHHGGSLVTWNIIERGVCLKKIIANVTKRFTSSFAEVYNTNLAQAGYFFLTLATQAQLV
jgi:hypothetical protein